MKAISFLFLFCLGYCQVISQDKFSDAGSNGGGSSKNSVLNESYAVIVGINEYPNLVPASQLTNCEKDAANFKQFLQNYGDETSLEAGHMAMLYGNNATKQNIIDTIKKVCARAPKNSTFYFYYSGQGEVKGIWPYDFQDCDICYLSYEELLTSIILKSGRFKTVVLMLDANYTGVGLNYIKKPKDETQAQQNDFWQNKTNNKVLVFATSPEYSLLKERNAYSTLLPLLKSTKADRNSDSIITADELSNYLKINEQERKPAVFFGKGGFPLSTLKRNLPIVRPVHLPPPVEVPVIVATPPPAAAPPPTVDIAVPAKPAITQTIVPDSGVSRPDISQVAQQPPVAEPAPIPTPQLVASKTDITPVDRQPPSAEPAPKPSAVTKMVEPAPAPIPAPKPVIYIPPPAPTPIVKEAPEVNTMIISNEPVMVRVEGGIFTMGHNPGDPDEKPYHNVILKDFYIDKFEVTIAEYRKFIRASHYITSAQRNGWGFVRNGDWVKQEGVNWDFDEYGLLKTTDNEDSVPVRFVSWNDANKYCEWLSKVTNKNYRLPTEAEWEYAAQGGKKNDGHVYIFSGSDNIDEVGWYHENSGSQVHKKGLKKPNELGLYDMSGNVSEWCSDYYDAQYYVPLEDLETHNPKGPATGSERVLRGGFFVSDPNSNRISSRDHNSPTICYGLYGFRVVHD